MAGLAMQDFKRAKMRIGGFVKQSLIDWEGVLAAVIFTMWCNFRCGYCHNPTLVLPLLLNHREDLNEKEIWDYLSLRRNWLEGVVVTGGEPTMQPDLADFLQGIKVLGYRVKLDTNGTRPDLLKELMARKLIDAVAMDVKHLPQLDYYARITPNITPEGMERICRSIALLRQSGIEYQFRTTIVPGIHSPEEQQELESLFATDPYVVHPFRHPGGEGILSDYYRVRRG